MKILVTGGAGFIGSHVCEELVGAGHRVVAIDNFNDYYPPALKESNLLDLVRHEAFELRRGDIVDTRFLSTVFEGSELDVIVHLAARAGVRPSILRPDIYVEVNIGGTLNLLEMARRHAVPRFVFASSSSVYGETKGISVAGEATSRPISPYGATKKAGELLAYTYCHLYGFDVTCLRFFTAYGPRQRPDMAVRSFAARILRGETVPIYGDGSSTRDYTYVSDVADAVVRSASTGTGFRVYDVGGGEPVPLGSLVQLLSRHLRRPARVEYLPMQPGDVSTTRSDNTTIRAELGWSPRVGVEEGVERFCRWLLKAGQ